MAKENEMKMLSKASLMGLLLWFMAVNVAFAESQQKGIWNGHDTAAAPAAGVKKTDVPQAKPVDSNEQTAQQELRNTPDSGASVADAHWVFTVPVYVKNLHPDVKKIGIICETSATLAGSATAYIERIGKEKTSVDVKGGKFSGNVTVPVKAGTGPDGHLYNSKSAVEKQNVLKRVDRYECKMYLVNQQGDWRIPAKDYPAGHWLAADPISPFQWSTDRKYLPH
jgi:hypothetical protein